MSFHELLHVLRDVIPLTFPFFPIPVVGAFSTGMPISVRPVCFHFPDCLLPGGHWEGEMLEEGPTKSVCAARTKYLSLGGVNSTCVLLTVVRPGKS